MNFNKVTLMGRLSRDPELRVTPKGMAICQFGFATNRTFKAEDGSQRDETTFVDVEAWGKTAENIAKYFTKGKPIFFEGRLKFEQWDDKTTGQKRSKLKVVLDTFQFIGGKEDNGASGGGAERSEAPPAHQQSTFGRDVPPLGGGKPLSGAKPLVPPMDNIDEDVPF